MLRVVIKKVLEVNSYLKVYLIALEDDYLSLQDWALLYTILDFLRPFFRATKATEGDTAIIN